MTDERGDVETICLEAGLTARQCEVILLHCKEGKAYPEIAVLLGITLSCVKSHATGARKRILREFKRQEELQARQEMLDEALANLRELRKRGLL